MSESLPWVPGILLPLLLFGLWCIWWLFCVNWKKVWPLLADGGWVPVLLLLFLSALAWSRIFPSGYDRLGFPIVNFVWQFGCVTALALVALLCGWVQGQLGWTPPEVSFDPPAHEHGHHGHHGGHH